MIRIREKTVILAVLASMFALLPLAQASAHVVVKPGEALTGAFDTFTVSVPSEKDSPTVNVKVEIPDGLQYVTPTVKNGWTIDAEKAGSGEDAKTKSITWSGGSVPAGFRDEFTFSAKLPATATELRWNAFQTYEDGTVVAWNVSEAKQPKKADGSPDFSTSGPFSVTKVTSAAGTGANNSHMATASEDKVDTAFTLALAAAAVSLVALYFATRRPRTKK